MAQFRPRRVSNDEALNNLPILEGQFIVVEETEEIYFDRSSSERIPLGSAQGVGTTLFIDQKKLQLRDKDNNVMSEVDMPIIANAVAWNTDTIEDVDDVLGVTTWTFDDPDQKIKFKPVMTNNKNTVPIRAGQLVYDKSEKALYVDIDDTNRRTAGVDAYTKQEIDDIMGDIVSLMEAL